MDLLTHLSAALDGRYEILREIGRGGMSVVFLARDLSLNREVALKALRPELTASVGAERFQREIQLVAHFEHIHLLQLHESGTADGVLYYIMPYARDGSLRDRLHKEGQLGLDDIVRITTEVADGLAHAHKQEVVHRDIKPENILFVDGHAVVADFGIAHAYSEAGGESITEYGVAIGTPAYMSPEQASGDPHIDHRSDIYSLACVVYEMLSGGPPFEGPTTQAVLAKHMQERVPSLAIVRPGIPGGMEEAVEKALKKVPADRFDAANEFSAALAAGVTTEAAAARPPHRRHGRLVAAIGLGIAALAAAVGISRVVETNPMLEANRILLFPMHETGFTILPSGLGEIAALRISSALEATEPFKSEWGGSFVPDSIERVQAETADAIAQDRRARFRFDGEIVEAGSNASIILRLYDVEGDSLVRQHTETGGLGTDSVLVIALAAASELLPSLVEPGRDVDRSAFRDRDLGATLLWMQGEQTYRQSRFAEALDFYERAIDRDSTLQMAALKGGQAASWLNRVPQATNLVRLALGSEANLPIRHRQFAHGLHHYLSGAADSAVVMLRAAIAADSTWADAWMALGETYHHLLPDATPRDSLAEAAFSLARTFDPEFTPPLVHLVQNAIWRGNVDTAAIMIAELERAHPDTGFSRQIQLMTTCVRDGVEATDWQSAAEGNPYRVLQAASSLTPGLRHSACAQAGFRAFLDSRQGTRLENWSATTALQSLLLAEGKFADVEQLLDSAVASGLDWANMLYVVDAIEGVPVEGKADAYLEQYRGDYTAVPFITRLWALGIWEVYRGNWEAVLGIARELDRRSTSSSSATARRRGRLLAEMLQAWVPLLQEDSTEALSRLRALTATGRRNDIYWSPFEHLGPERIKTAELLLAAGQNRDAYRIAAEFDLVTAPITYLIYLPRSLVVRARAAEAMADPGLAQRHRERLAAIGRSDLLVAEP